MHKYNRSLFLTIQQSEKIPDHWQTETGFFSVESWGQNPGRNGSTENGKREK